MRDNLHLLLITDDWVFLNNQIQTLVMKGIKTVTLPTVYDSNSIIPFLLMNDHSVLIVNKPKPDVLQMLKLIMRTGTVRLKNDSKPIKINVTIWVIIDIHPWLEKLAQ